MKISEFKELLASPGWFRHQEIKVIDKNVSVVLDWDEESKDTYIKKVVEVWGWASLTSTREGVAIRYTEQFNFAEGDFESFSASPEGMDPFDIWAIEGVLVEDEDGNKLQPWELAELLACELQEFYRINYSAIAL